MPGPPLSSKSTQELDRKSQLQETGQWGELPPSGRPDNEEGASLLSLLLQALLQPSSPTGRADHAQLRNRFSP